MRLAAALAAFTVATSAGTVMAQSPNAGEPFDSALLDWHALRNGHEIAATRFGEIRIAYTGEGGERGGDIEVRFDGKLVAPPIPRRGNTYSVLKVSEVFEFGDRDVVLLYADGGGSGTPSPLLHLIVVRAGGAGPLLTNPEFRSADWTTRVATDGSRIFFDLGYERREAKTAVFDGDRIRIYRAARDPAPLSEDDCRFLYGWVNGPSCLLRQGLPNAALHRLADLEQRPGFHRELFERMCEEAGQRGVAPPHESFELTVCTLH
jgi:hypothetical protein